MLVLNIAFQLVGLLVFVIGCIPESRVHGFSISQQRQTRYSVQTGQRRRRYSLLTLSSVTDRFDLTDNFNRWRFLQKMLDEEVEADTLNELLYIIINSYVSDKSRKAPERTTELLELVSAILKKYSSHDCNNGPSMIPALQDPGNIPGVALEDVAQLLPDPIEQEEAFKGAWDTVGELLGKSSLAVNEKEGRPEWKAIFLVARVMIYFGFVAGEGLKN